MQFTCRCRELRIGLGRGRISPDRLAHAVLKFQHMTQLKMAVRLRLQLQRLAVAAFRLPQLAGFLERVAVCTQIWAREGSISRARW